MSILLFEDKLGITSGYTARWEEMCLRAGILPKDIIRKSAHRHPAVGNMRILVKYKNRKAPSFNTDPEVFNRLWAWFKQITLEVNPDLIVIQDQALLGFVDADQQASTIDNLRGGLYWFTIGGRRIPIIITVPISAINTGRKIKDIKILNDGASNKEEWESRREAEFDSDEGDDNEIDPEDFYMEPYSIPEGSWILKTDLKKISRLHTQQVKARLT